LRHAAALTSSAAWATLRARCGPGSVIIASAHQAQPALGQLLAALLHGAIGQAGGGHGADHTLQRQAIELRRRHGKRIGQGNVVVERTQLLGFGAAKQRLQRRQRDGAGQLKRQSHPLVVGIQDRLDSHQRKRIWIRRKHRNLGVVMPTMVNGLLM
jgi:hypothetical protein